MKNRKEPTKRTSEQEGAPASPPATQQTRRGKTECVAPSRLSAHAGRGNGESPVRLSRSLALLLSSLREVHPPDGMPRRTGACTGADSLTVAFLAQQQFILLLRKPFRLFSPPSLFPLQPRRTGFSDVEVCSQRVWERRRAGRSRWWEELHYC